MNPKLALHWADTAHWMRRVDMPAPFVKVVNPPTEDIFPGKMTIGRLYMSDGKEGTFYMRGTQGGADYYNLCRDSYRERAYVHAWECWNEPAMIHTPEERQALDEATAEWVRLMHEEGRRCVVGNFSERNPADGAIAEFAAMLESADYLGLHMYGAPRMTTEPEGHVLRYRQLAGEIQSAGLRLPTLLIGECGIDGGIVGKGRKGWQKFTDWPGYFSDLRWYEGELAKDAYVAGAFVFTAAPGRDWLSFGINEKQAAELGAWQRTIAEPAPVQPDWAWLMAKINDAQCAIDAAREALSEATMQLDELKAEVGNRGGGA